MGFNIGTEDLGGPMIVLRLRRVAWHGDIVDLVWVLYSVKGMVSENAVRLGWCAASQAVVK